MDMVRSGKITDFHNVDLESFHSLIVQNMNLMKSAVAADSSSTNNEMHIEALGGPKKLTPLNYNRLIIGQNEYSVTSELEQETVNDEDDECLLVELDGSQSPDTIDLESESEAEDCLLVELADRISEKHTPPITPTMNEEDEFGHPGLVTSYEKDDEYIGHEDDDDDGERNYVNSSTVFTTEQDLQLISILKDIPELWYPKQTKTPIDTMNTLWKKINKQMPKGLNSRERWRAMKRSFKKSLRSGNHQYAEELQFLKKFKNNTSKSKNTTKLEDTKVSKPDKVLMEEYKLRVTTQTKNEKIINDEKEMPHNTNNNSKKMQIKSKSFTETKPHSMVVAKLNKTTTDSKIVNNNNPFQDHEFIVKMIRVIEKYPQLWHPHSDLVLKRLPQPKTWAEVHKKLNTRKYAVQDIKMKWKSLRACYTKSTASVEQYRELLHFLNFKKDI